jgi:hypothetical protein
MQAQLPRGAQKEVWGGTQIVICNGSQLEWSVEFAEKWRLSCLEANTAEDLMETLVLLEASIDKEWLAAAYSSTRRPSPSSLLRSASISAIALRIFELDTAIRYTKSGGRHSNRRTAQIPRGMYNEELMDAHFEEEARRQTRFVDPPDGRRKRRAAVNASAATANIYKLERQGSDTYLEDDEKELASAKASMVKKDTSHRVTKSKDVDYDDDDDDDEEEEEEIDDEEVEDDDEEDYEEEVKKKSPRNKSSKQIRSQPKRKRVDDDEDVSEVEDDNDEKDDEEEKDEDDDNDEEEGEEDDEENDERDNEIDDDEEAENDMDGSDEEQNENDEKEDDDHDDDDDGPPPSIPYIPVERPSGKYMAAQRYAENANDELASTCLSILDRISEETISEPFLYPVDIESFPDYMNFVDEPMDLTTIRENVESNTYADNPMMFANDVRLVWAKCMKYNNEDSRRWEHARRLSVLSEELFERLW